ncbi:MAG: RING finger protein, partial [Planctomycetota bacterium]|nr:RING finger protein [Planctomycetota bacterium]
NCQSFDERFQVSANDQVEAKKFLSEGVRGQMLKLSSFIFPKEVWVCLHDGLLQVNKQSYLWEQQKLEDFVELGLELFEQVMLTQMVGIDFVDDAPGATSKPPKCQICGEIIQFDQVVCIRCRTPHCKDCWEYNGQCATYGCGENRFVVDRTEKPLDH